MFSNDGSFLDQFKQQMSDTKKSIFEQKITISSIKSDKVRENNNSDRNYRCVFVNIERLFNTFIT